MWIRPKRAGSSWSEKPKVAANGPSNQFLPFSDAWGLNHAYVQRDAAREAIQPVPLNGGKRKINDTVTLDICSDSQKKARKGADHCFGNSSDGIEPYTGIYALSFQEPNLALKGLDEQQGQGLTIFPSATVESQSGWSNWHVKNALQPLSSVLNSATSSPVTSHVPYLSGSQMSDCLKKADRDHLNLLMDNFLPSKGAMTALQKVHRPKASGLSSHDNKFQHFLGLKKDSPAKNL